MEITPITSAPSNTSASPATGGGLSSDFDTFLTLLTAQIRNQDPLDPSDSTEFVAQLATFSTVEQQAKTNTLLEGIQQLSRQSEFQNVSSWIGKDVEVSGRPIEASQVPVDIAFRAIPGDQLTLNVRTDDGVLLGSQSITHDTNRLNWDGRLAGEKVTGGPFILEVETLQNGESRGAVSVSNWVRVQEVRFDEQEPKLVTSTGDQLRIDDIRGLRADAD